MFKSRSFERGQSSSYCNDDASEVLSITEDSDCDLAICGDITLTIDVPLNDEVQNGEIGSLKLSSLNLKQHAFFSRLKTKASFKNLVDARNEIDGLNGVTSDEDKSNNGSLEGRFGNGGQEAFTTKKRERSKEVDIEEIDIPSKRFSNVRAENTNDSDYGFFTDLSGELDAPASTYKCTPNSSSHQAAALTLSDHDHASSVAMPGLSSSLGHNTCSGLTTHHSSSSTGASGRGGSLSSMFMAERGAPQSESPPGSVVEFLDEEINSITTHRTFYWACNGIDAECRTAMHASVEGLRRVRLPSGMLETQFRVVLYTSGVPGSSSSSSAAFSSEHAPSLPTLLSDLTDVDASSIDLGASSLSTTQFAWSSPVGAPNGISSSSSSSSSRLSSMSSESSASIPARSLSEWCSFPQLVAGILRAAGNDLTVVPCLAHYVVRDCLTGTFILKEPTLGGLGSVLQSPWSWLTALTAGTTQQQERAQVSLLGRAFKELLINAPETRPFDIGTLVAPCR
jgi:hypothetical protein